MTVSERFSRSNAQNDPYAGKHFHFLASSAGSAFLSMNTISISTLSEKSGLSVATIRYYEQLGLIQSRSRLAGKPRYFQSDTIRRLEAMRKLQELGFTLREICALVALGGTASSRVKKFLKTLQEKLEENDAALALRKRLRNKIKKTMTHCKSSTMDFYQGAIGELLSLNTPEHA
jgi:DNA-binding transcriptional MerR regulator